MHINKWKTREVTYYIIRFQIYEFWKGEIIKTSKGSVLLGVPGKGGWEMIRQSTGDF